MQLPHGGMRSSLSYLPILWGRAASGETSGASMVPDGKLWHFHRQLQAATNAVCMCSTPQMMLPANEMFKGAKGVGHPTPIGFSFLSASLNSQPQSSPPSPSTELATCGVINAGKGEACAHSHPLGTRCSAQSERKHTDPSPKLSSGSSETQHIHGQLLPVLMHRTEVFSRAMPWPRSGIAAPTGV